MSGRKIIRGLEEAIASVRSDPVAVDAGLMARLTDDAIDNLYIEHSCQRQVLDYEKVEALLRDCRAALQAERERAAERMRERAAEAGDKAARGNGRTVGELVGAAIRALPLSETETKT